MGNIFISSNNKHNNNYTITQKNTVILSNNISSNNKQLQEIKFINLYKLKYKITSELEIKFINSFNEELDKKFYDLFEMYDKIIFGFSFNKVVKNKFPSNINFIQFGHNFNYPIDNLILDTHSDIKINELILGDTFNFPINNLPPKLKKLH